MKRLHAYAQLVRLPNVFTAVADIGLAGLATGAWATAWLPLAMVLLASASLYCSGMVWNDFFDYEQDRRERPFRPLPSGRVARTVAARLGAGLMAAGLFWATFAGWRTGGWNWSPLVLAGLLVVAILLYDGWLKRTWAGPLGMGTCRFLNVLLGLSAVDNWQWPWGIHLASVVGLYIVGVTWFARTEARVSSQPALAGAAAVVLSALGLALSLWLSHPEASSPLFPYLLVGLGFWLGIPMTQAIAQPKPARVQGAVKRALAGLIVLDAVLATALAGSAGLILLALLPPMLLLGRWLYST
jgi:4-hydroxybenzoate polyprenyltransferase